MHEREFIPVLVKFLRQNRYQRTCNSGSSASNTKSALDLTSSDVIVTLQIQSGFCDY
jgi:hypothetical protein